MIAELYAWLPLLPFLLLIWGFTWAGLRCIGRAHSQRRPHALTGRGYGAGAHSLRRPHALTGRGYTGQCFDDGRGAA